tara:strand:+ start:333 stop:521 length:189 start_codon:yes stop_codon:yes gene_type:complete
MTYNETSALMGAMRNVEIYAEAKALEYQKETTDFKKVNKYNDKINEGKQIIWDFANQQGNYK